MTPTVGLWGSEMEDVFIRVRRLCGGEIRKRFLMMVKVLFDESIFVWKLI